MSPASIVVLLPLNYFLNDGNPKEEELCNSFLYFYLQPI